MRFDFDLDKRHYNLTDDDGNPLNEVNQFLQSLNLRGLSDRTIRAYGFDLLCIFRWLKNQNQTFHKSLTPKDLEGFIASERAREAKPRSINRRLTTFELFFRYSFGSYMEPGAKVSYPSPYFKGQGLDRRLGLFWRHKPTHLKLRVKVPKTLIDPLDAEEINEFFRHVHRYRDIAITLLMLFCGLRSREVLNLEHENIDFMARQIRINGKGNKERILPLPDRLVAVIKKYIAFERPQLCTNPCVFVLLQGEGLGKSMTQSGLRSLFRSRRIKSGVTKANPHRFRHTFGSDMARSGVQLPILQQMMGHADIQTTLKYINLALADVAAEYDRAMGRLKDRYGL